MESLSYRYTTPRRAAGTRPQALVGVVASGNLEVLVERVLPDNECLLEIKTAAVGFGTVWAAVTSDFIERGASGGLKLSINDGGARPDTVSLRLAQAVRVIEGDDQ
jgi:malonate decarboxylase delta subunit